MRVGVVQMTSTDDLAANLQAARALVAVAVHRGAELVALPENFAYLRREGVPIPCAQGLDGEIVGTVRELAKENRIWLLGGTFPESAEADGRVYNTSVLVSPGGEIEAVYRKIHLFDVDLRGSGGGVFTESATIAPGKEVVVASTPFGPLGLAVCYDLRFPERPGSRTKRPPRPAAPAPLASGFKSPAVSADDGASSLRWGGAFNG